MNHAESRRATDFFNSLLEPRRSNRRELDIRASVAVWSAGVVGAGYGHIGRLLIVDDDPVICDALSDILGAEGFEAACAQTDSAAYALIRRFRPFGR